MKLRITTILSLVGVLGAGSAAALVNTQVLQKTDAKSSGNVMVASQANSDTSAGIAPTAEVTKINSNVLTSTQAMYQIGDAGFVTLDTTGNVLTVVSATPNSGWTVISAESAGSADIEVKLQSATTLVEFKANLDAAGVITTSVESKLVGSAGDGGLLPGNGTTSGDGSIDVHGDDVADDVEGDDDEGVDVTVGVEIEHEDDGGDD